VTEPRDPGGAVPAPEPDPQPDSDTKFALPEGRADPADRADNAYGLFEPEPEVDTLLPVRMLNEFAYCPRLFHLMHVEGRFADNAYTVDGRHVHRRVDKLDHVLPEAVSGGAVSSKEAKADEVDGASGVAEPEGDAPPEVARSVPLASDVLGLTCKLDLVSTAGDEAVPVETKRGRVPNNPERSWEPERVQVMAQGLILREHGYRCDHGVLYFAASKTRVDVPFDPLLEDRTRRLIREAHDATRLTVLPPPLVDSPKCRGCSLNGICLPDETHALQTIDEEIPIDAAGRPEVEKAPGVGHVPVRRMYAARPRAKPMYVQEHGAFVGKNHSRLTVKKQGEKLGDARLKDVSQLVLCGNVSVSAAVVGMLCDAAIPIVYLSGNHYFRGLTHGFGLRNAFDRAAQFRAADDPQRCLDFARQLVADKVANQRTLLRRNVTRGRELDTALRDFDDLMPRIPKAASLPTLLGLEGNAARVYFGRFADMLKPKNFDSAWDFKNRNRRPPRDPVNALLSFGYALLAKECTVALMAEGLDPYWGFYHQPRHGRPALALDLMEPFRPVVVDSAVLTAINTGMVKKRNFVTAASGCVLQDAGRKAFIQAYEGRLDQLVTHPVFDYRCSWRAVIQLQARLLSRWLRGDIPRFENVVTR